MNPTLEQLARYAAQELERGVPEITLTSALRESGWTQAWISAAISTAKQRAVPAVRPALDMPAVHQEKPAALAVRPITPVQPRSLTRPIQPAPKQPRRQRSTTGLRKALVILVALLSTIAAGLGAYRAISYIQHEAQQKVVRDAARREDLSVLLSDLSDYFVNHQSYPTRTQMDTLSFREQNSFIADSIADPKWSPENEACAQDGKPSLAGVSTPDCYSYEATTAKSGVCNNGTAPCTKVKVSIWLEVDKKPYEVTFDKNSQTD